MGESSAVGGRGGGNALGVVGLFSILALDVAVALALALALALNTVLYSHRRTLSPSISLSPYFSIAVSLGISSFCLASHIEIARNKTNNRFNAPNTQ